MAKNETQKADANVQKAVDEAEAKGYIGTTPDDTPNENYTVAGVLAGKPTPETTRAAK